MLRQAGRCIAPELQWHDGIGRIATVISRETARLVKPAGRGSAVSGRSSHWQRKTDDIFIVTSHGQLNIAFQQVIYHRPLGILL